MSQSLGDMSHRSQEIHGELQGIMGTQSRDDDSNMSRLYIFRDSYMK